jgi:hypothetical protein
MPLVFVHGVANRPGAARDAATAQRDALFRSITFDGQPVRIFNPDWGSSGVSFSTNSPWLPPSKALQEFGAGTQRFGGAATEVGLGPLAKFDGAQAVDLAVMATLEVAIAEAIRSGVPAAAASSGLIELAGRAASYLAATVTTANAAPAGIASLVTADDLKFAEALRTELELLALGDVQAFGVGSTIRDGIQSFKGWIGNAGSDVLLRRKRRALSENVALFLGDVFVYLRNREIQGPTGTTARLFEPIASALTEAANSTDGREPFVVVGHSLGGVLLYDLLTDENCLSKIRLDAPTFRIDLLLTVGSQPGFFADLGLYPSKTKTQNGKLAAPLCAKTWFNVYDFTDALSFLCEPFFDGVTDFGYDTVVDLIEAHSAYFKRPSFYRRLRLRLNEVGKP